MGWVNLTVAIELAVLDAALIIMVIEVITLVKYTKKLLDKKVMALIGNR